MQKCISNLAVYKTELRFLFLIFAGKKLLEEKLIALVCVSYEV